MFTPTIRIPPPPSPLPSLSILKPSIVMTIQYIGTALTALHPRPGPRFPVPPSDSGGEELTECREFLRWELSEVGTISQHDANITIKKYQISAIFG